MTFIALTAALILVSFSGVWLTLQVRAGGPWWLPIISGTVSYLCWGAATRWTTVNLVVLSAWWDVVVALIWFVGFWWLGHEDIRPLQFAGIALLCAGLALINLK